MSLDGFAEAETSDGQKLKVQSEGLAVWKKYSKHRKDGNLACFYWLRGEIIVKNPDREILGKMFRIAQKLSARVQGDEGEVYGENGKQVP